MTDALALPRVPLRKRVRRAVRAQALSAVFALCAVLPLRAALALGAFVGTLVYRFARKERKRALAHLELAFPERTGAERTALARASFQGLGRSALELTQLRKLDIKAYVRWPEAQIAALREALAVGRGGVFVTGHIGAWELLARRIVAEGFDHVVIGRRSGDAALAQRIEAFRSAGGVRVIGRGQGSAPLREILSAFRRGALVGLLIDQDTRVQGRFVPFFGRAAHTPIAAEELAKRTGGPVVVGFIHRRAEGGHLLTTEVFRPGVASLEDPKDDLTAALTARIEREVRTHPTDWVWMHARWKRRPAPQPV